MPLYRNFEPHDWVLCEIDARSHHKVICQLDFGDRLDGARFIRHPMPEDFRLYQTRFVFEGTYIDRISECQRLTNLKYVPCGASEWAPVDYGAYDWAIEGGEVVSKGMLICTRPEGPFFSDDETPIVLNAIAHVPRMMAALQAVNIAHSAKQKTAAMKQVRDVLRSLDVIK